MNTVAIVVTLVAIGLTLVFFVPNPLREKFRGWTTMIWNIVVTAGVPVVMFLLDFVSQLTQNVDFSPVVPPEYWPTFLVLTGVLNFVKNLNKVDAKLLEQQGVVIHRG